MVMQNPARPVQLVGATKAWHRKTLWLYLKSRGQFVVASISTRTEHGLFFPTWFLGVICAAVLSTSVVVGGAALSTWRQADESTIKNHEQDDRFTHMDGRLDRLENLSADVSAMRGEVSSTHDLAQRTNDKLDRLIDRQLDRGRSDRGSAQSR